MSDCWKCEGAAEADRCKLIAETARVFIVYFTPDGLITYVNKFAEEVGGRLRQDVIGQNLLLYIPEREHVKVHNEIRRVLEGEISLDFESLIITASGEEREMLWSGCRVINENGVTEGIVASGIDVTDARRFRDALAKSEHLYRTLVDHSLAGIFIVQDGKFVYANHRAEEIAGYTVEETWEFSILTTLVHPDYRALVADRMSKRLAGEPVTDRYEYVMITKSGQLKVVEIWSTMIEHNARPAILATVIDISDRKRAEEARIAFECELERQKADFYKQAITAVTQGVLEIMEPEMIERYLSDPVIDVPISEPSHVTMTRYLIRDTVVRAGMKGDRMEGFMLAVGEAAANALKHTGGGQVMAGVRDGNVWAAVIDDGPGMDTLLLTQAVFRKGFSTKPSLGLGYTFILEGSDHVVLSTGPTGTIVVMERSLVAPRVPNILDLPKPWDKSIKS